jgi:hypothetical protein
MFSHNFAFFNLECSFYTLLNYRNKSKYLVPIPFLEVVLITVLPNHNASSLALDMKYVKEWIF